MTTAFILQSFLGSLGNIGEGYAIDQIIFVDPHESIVWLRTPGKPPEAHIGIRMNASVGLIRFYLDLTDGKLKVENRFAEQRMYQVLNEVNTASWMHGCKLVLRQSSGARPVFRASYTMHVKPTSFDGDASNLQNLVRFHLKLVHKESLLLLNSLMTAWFTPQDQVGQARAKH